MAKEEKKSRRVVQGSHLRPKGRGLRLFALYNVYVVLCSLYFFFLDFDFDFDFVDLSESNPNPSDANQTA